MKRSDRRSFVKGIAQAGVILPTARTLGWGALGSSLGMQNAWANGLFQLIPTKPQSTLRVGFGSCFDVRRGDEHPIWNEVLRCSTDVWLSMGDNIYARDGQIDDLPRNYRRLARIPSYRRLREQALMLSTWDDHDYGINNGGADFFGKEQAKQHFFDHVGLRSDDPHRAQDGVYFSYLKEFEGRQIHFILLDLRFGQVRGEGTDSRLMSDEQWQWFTRELGRRADLKIVVSSIQALPAEHRFEKWANFPHERARLLELLGSGGAAAAPVVLLSGDRHQHEHSQLVLPSGHTLTEVTSSGMNRATPSDRLLPEENELRVWRGGNNGFGVLDIDCAGDGRPQILARVLDERARVMHQSEIRI